MTSIRRPKMIALVWAIALLLAACAPPSTEEPTAVVDTNAIRTEAVATFASSLTGTALVRPTATVTPTPIPTITSVALGTLTTSTAAVGGPVASCGGLVYVADVTIPDNTSMTPGQTFTKTWRVQNSGTCAWAPGYKFSLVGGDAMGGLALTLSQPVAVGATTELSVAMTAPTGRTGTIQGTWRMSDDKGVFFGDALTVVIVVGGAGPTSTTGAATSAPTSTNTATPTP